MATAAVAVSPTPEPHPPARAAAQQGWHDEHESRPFARVHLFPDATAVAVSTRSGPALPQLLRGGALFLLLAAVAFGTAQLRSIAEHEAWFRAGLVVCAATLLTAGALLLVARRLERARARRIWPLYARARGLEYRRTTLLSPVAPVLAVGRHRAFAHLATGDVAGANTTIGTFRAIAGTGDVERELTFVLRPLAPVVQRWFPRTSCEPHGTGSFDATTRTAMMRMGVGRRSVVRVAREQDDVLLARLFDRDFLRELDSELHVHWQQVGAVLVAWWEGLHSEPRALDELAYAGWRLAEHYRLVAEAAAGRVSAQPRG